MGEADSPVRVSAAAVAEKASSATRAPIRRTGTRRRRIGLIFGSYISSKEMIRTPRRRSGTGIGVGGFLLGR
jgi:hypothetical protein